MAVLVENVEITLYKWQVEACLWPPFFNALSIKCSENATHDHLVRLYVQHNATSNNSVFNVVFTRQLSLPVP